MFTKKKVQYFDEINTPMKYNKKLSKRPVHDVTYGELETRFTELTKHSLSFKWATFVQ